MSDKDNSTIILRKVRGRYLNLFRPNEFKGKQRYGMAIQIPKDDKAMVKQINDLQDKLIKEKYTRSVPASLKKLLGESDLGPEFYVLKAYRQLSQRAPLVLGRDATPINEGAVDEPYDGCWVDVKLSCYIPKDHDTVCATLVVVQFRGDGEPLGASVPVAEAGEFAPVPEGAESLL